jgi:serine/threonine-protein kinase HipA
MIFNVVFCNTDDHLKNHSFIYNSKSNQWNLAPAYDVTYSLNPLINYTRISRALSINGKRIDIVWKDIEVFADNYTIKNPKQLVLDVQAGIDFCALKMKEYNIPTTIIHRIVNDFVILIP